MSQSLGDFDTSTVVYGKFTTYRPSTGAPHTLAGTPALSVYKDNSVTQSTAGITLTADFDSVTGFNHFAIDTSADGTFYAAGSFFDIVITTGTVDSVSAVGTVVGSFTLRKTSTLKPTTAGRTLDVSAGGEAGVDWANVGGQSTAVNLSDTTVNLTNTVTTYTGNTPQTGDSFARIGATGSGLTTLATQASVNTIDDFLDTEIAAILAAVDTEVAAILEDTGTTIPAQISALNNLSAAAVNAEVDAALSDVGLTTTVTGRIDAAITTRATPAQILTTALTEAYAALGVAPTLAQLLFELRALQAEKAVASTTVTTKQLDGSTTAATYTLDDDTNPTSITRAT